MRGRSRESGAAEGLIVEERKHFKFSAAVQQYRSKRLHFHLKTWKSDKNPVILADLLDGDSIRPEEAERFTI